MIKMLVVDDEFFIRRGIIDSIPWADYQIEICGEATNGEDALAKLYTLKPDIILTDIRMSPMNGLEFIDTVRKTHSHIKIIILSGYDEFEYARKAISLGVSEYLLKPVGAEELIRIVTEARDSILRERSSMKKAISMRLSALSAWSTPKNQISLESSWFCVFMFCVENPNDFISSASEKDSQTDSLSRITEDYFTKYALNHIVKKLQDNVYTVMLNYPDSFFDTRQAANAFQEYLSAKYHIMITIGLGQSYYGYSQLNTSYNEAFSALSYKYGLVRYSIISVSDIPKTMLRDYMHNMEFRHFSKESQFMLSYLKDSGEKLNLYITSLFERMAKQSLSLEGAKTLILKLIILASYTIDIAHYSRMDCKKTIAFYKEIMAADSMSTLQEVTDASLTMLLRLYDSICNLEYQNMVRTVISYMQHHYASNISLNSLAEIVHVTPNYLSRVFKETTGENFKEWLTKFRLEKSKQFLADPSLKIYEVAKMAGFYDYKYFSQVFRKYNGLSASDYRASLFYNGAAMQDNAEDDDS